MLFALSTFACAVAVVGLEVYTGQAYQGFTGGQRVVLRKQHPGPFWFVIFIHAVSGCFFTAIAAAIGQA